MACEITGGIALGCKDNMGGITEVYFANKSNVSAVTEAAGVVSAITMVATKTFYAFKLNKNTGSYTETINSSPENGTTFYEQSVNLVFSKMEATKRNNIKILAEASLVAIVKDNNGKYWYLGRVHGVDLTEGNGSTGVQKGDNNGYNLTFKGQEAEPAPEVESAIVIGALVSGL